MDFFSHYIFKYWFQSQDGSFSDMQKILKAQDHHAVHQHQLWLESPVYGELV